MADPIGKYVELGVGSPDNIKAFGLVNTTDTSEFASSPSIYDNAPLTNANNAKTLVVEFTPSKVTIDWDKIKTMGFSADTQSQYSAVRFEPRYNCLVDRTQLANIINSEAQWQSVTLGEKPEDWDENWSQYYYTAQPMGNNYGENKVYRAVTSATFNPNTQYYRNDVVGHHYYLIDGDKRLRFFLGKCGISEDSLRPAVNIFKRNSDDGSSRDPEGFWCLQQKVNNEWVTTPLTGTFSAGRQYGLTTGDNNVNTMFMPGNYRFLSGSITGKLPFYYSCSEFSSPSSTRPSRNPARGLFSWALLSITMAWSSHSLAGYWYILSPFLLYTAHMVSPPFSDVLYLCCP